MGLMMSFTFIPLTFSSQNEKNLKIKPVSRTTPKKAKENSRPNVKKHLNF